MSQQNGGGHSDGGNGERGEDATEENVGETQGGCVYQAVSLHRRREDQGPMLGGAVMRAWARLV